jgi:DNA-binding NarL/FixJ family response regulator
MEARPTTVLMADDHTMFREGLAALLTSYGGLEMVGETTNDQGAVALARQTKPDVVIMQVQMPFEKAKEALDRMRAVEPAPKVVIVTMFEDPRSDARLLEAGGQRLRLEERLVTTAHRHGARRGVRPGGGQRGCGDAARDARGGRGRLRGGPLGAEAGDSAAGRPGLSNRQIAARVHLAEGTVKRHLHNTYHKMEVGSRGEGVRKALHDEWITISEITEREQE